MFLTNIVLKYFSVYLAALFKFIGGILVGVAEGLSALEISIFTCLGGMTTIFFVVFFGNTFRKDFVAFFAQIKYAYLRFLIFIIEKFNLFSDEKRIEKIERLNGKMKPKKFNKTTRLALKTWSKFGILGIAVLTPLILSPIGGALIAVSFRVNTKKVIIYMTLSLFIFALLFAFFFIEFRDVLEERFGLQLHTSD